MTKICVQFDHGDCIVYDSIDEAAVEIEDQSSILDAHYLGDSCFFALYDNIRENEREAADERATINTLRDFSL